MLRSYVIDGQQVTVTRVQRHPTVYTIRVAGTPAAGAVERTPLGRYLAVDEQRRPLGTFPGLRPAVERMVRAAWPGGGSVAATGNAITGAAGDGVRPPRKK